MDLDDKEIGDYFTMLGTQVGGKYSAGIENGVELTLNLLLAKGSVRIFGRDNKIRRGSGSARGSQVVIWIRTTTRCTLGPCYFLDVYDECALILRTCGTKANWRK